MRIRKVPGLSDNYDPSYLSELFREIAQQINGITEGNMHSFHSALTAAPTTGTWAQSDEVLNRATTELGSAGSKYVLIGWKCVASGTPGTWVELRCLTGS